MLTSRNLIWIATAGILIAVGPAAGQPAAAPTAPIIIGPDTTRVTGPVKDDGTIDYIAAYNAHQSAGVTADNNAAVLMVQAFGPGCIGEVVRAQVLDALNLKDLPEQGAYFVELQADEATVKRTRVELCRKPWRAEDAPVVAAWIAANEPALALLTQAAQRPRIWYPACADPKNPTMLGVMIPALGKLRSVVYALGDRAMLRLGKDDPAGACADLLTIHRLSRFAGQGGTFIERLVGMAGDSFASNGDQSWACDIRVTGAMAKAYLAQLEALPGLPNIHDAIDAGERFICLDEVMLLRRNGGDPSFLAPMLSIDPSDLPNNLASPDIDWNKVLRQVNAWYDRVAAITSKRFTEQSPLWEKVKADVVAAKAAVATESDPTERMEDFIVGRFIPMLDMACLNYEKAETNFEETEVALAARVFYAQKGKWPRDLGELVPAYLKAVPVDRFTDNQPLRMRAEGDGVVIWSIGPKSKSATAGPSEGLKTEVHVK